MSRKILNIGLLTVILHSAISCTYAAPIRDPFLRPANYQNVVEAEKEESKIKQSDIKINMIYYAADKQSRFVMINNKIYLTGEFIGSNRIVTIAPDALVVSDGVTKMTLPFQSKILTKRDV